MARLRRQWGYQARRYGATRWGDPSWCATRLIAERLIQNGPALLQDRRLVSRVVSDPEVVPHG